MDLALGDPEWFPHPVRLIGKATEFLEPALRSFARDENEDLVAGGFLTVLLTVGTFAAARQCLSILEPKRKHSYAVSHIVLAWTTLALRNLLDEAESVLAAAEVGNLPLARKRLARIVGRDTANLDQSEIARAVIETVAEGTCDGVIAPMFYLVLGGAPLSLAFKAVSTLDSLIGHRDDRYLYFGRVAARTDDVANYLPARITAASICLAAISCGSMHSRRAFETWKRDGTKHASPNAGQSEAAMAGALGVRLGGTNSYDGELHIAPYLGAEFETPTIQDARKALKLAFGASLIAFAAGLLLTLWGNGGE